MVWIIDQSYEDKLSMYMSLEKEELARMLIESNGHLDSREIKVEGLGDSKEIIDYEFDGDLWEVSFC